MGSKCHCHCIHVQRHSEAAFKGHIRRSFRRSRFRRECWPRSPDTAGALGRRKSANSPPQWAGKIGLTAEAPSPTPESDSMTMLRCVHASLALMHAALSMNSLRSLEQPSDATSRGSVLGGNRDAGPCIKAPRRRPSPPPTASPCSVLLSPGVAHLRGCIWQNSNLVLTAETRTRDAAEPSGEPDSLWGRMKGKMGDRVRHSQPEELAERKVKAKKKCAP